MTNAINATVRKQCAYPYSSQIAENTDVHGLRRATFQGSIEIPEFP